MLMVGFILGGYRVEGDIITVNGYKVKVFSFNTVVVGSGAAGLNAADRLYNFGQKDIAIITEGINMGTSRNTGSDKQTYYKLTLAGKEGDSVYDMARTLYEGGSMDGDIALVEAALSTQCFYHLVELGVPFPHNRSGEFVGYKTDHDPRQRATSAGPLTSKLMTEKLEEEVRKKKIRIFDAYQVIGILKRENGEEEEVIGLLTLNKNFLEGKDKRYVLFNCRNIIYATGGSAGIYRRSVYPESQTGATGLALEAGVRGKNLTEWQYGIASIKFRWNLSGTYQQVLPRYISTDQDGKNEKEFLDDYFPDPGKMLGAVFRKGYQWPFDPQKISNYGSSLIDILVYNETVLKGRRVWLDYTKNPYRASNGEKLDFSLLDEESYRYLKKSEALIGRPIDRLEKMNLPAIELYRDHGIDLRREYLEIAVSAQHNNGGLEGNIWWESNLKHFFPVGEVNGSHGVYRPGGAALNSGQVASTRAAQYIAINYSESPLGIGDFIGEVKEQIITKIEMGESFIENIGEESNIMALRQEIGKRMDQKGALIRSRSTIEEAIEESRFQLKSLIEKTLLSSIKELPLAFQNYDLLLTQYVYLAAMKDYIDRGGKSRGSYLVYDSTGELPLTGLDERFRFSLIGNSFMNKIQKITYCDGCCSFQWEKVKEIPKEDHWFENVWNRFMENKNIE